MEDTHQLMNCNIPHPSTGKTPSNMGDVIFQKSLLWGDGKYLLEMGGKPGMGNNIH